MCSFARWARRRIEITKSLASARNGTASSRGFITLNVDAAVANPAALRSAWPSVSGGPGFVALDLRRSPDALTARGC
jgi:hypothetical protein